MPYITIKTATTLDGKIATSENVSKWITGEDARREVQNLRNRYDAILTGSNTVIVDNPSLTCRKRNGRNPIRVILDTHLSTSYEHNVYKNDGTKVILVTSKNTKVEDFNRHAPHVEILKCEEKNNHIDLKDAIKKLYNIGIMSILVEAGGRINKSFVEEKLADDLIQFIAPKILGDSSGQGFINGFSRKTLTHCNILDITTIKRIKNDIMIVGSFNYLSQVRE